MRIDDLQGVFERCPVELRTIIAGTGSAGVSEASFALGALPEEPSLEVELGP